MADLEAEPYGGELRAAVNDLEPALFLGKVASKEMNQLEVQDYLVSPEGYIGFKTGDLARLAIAGGKDAVLWVRPVRIASEHSPRAEIGQKTFVGGAVEISYERRRVKVDEAEVQFQNQEFKVLYYLATNEGQVLRRQQILDACWSDWPSIDRVVDVNVSTIRKKLGDYSGLIKTIRGSGYMFEDFVPETSNT
jgi:DNA-binding winged helix-turn-helix (wHTH) protein